MAKQCCKRVYGSQHPFGGSPCSKPAKVELNGKWFCAIHDPEAVAKRQKKSDEKWEAEQAKMRERGEAIKEAHRRAECFPELLAAQTMGAELNTPDFLDWIADRLVNVHGERPEVDYVRSLRARAAAGRAALLKATTHERR